jgi:hypothetical protein
VYNLLQCLELLILENGQTHSSTHASDLSITGLAVAQNETITSASDDSVVKIWRWSYLSLFLGVNSSPEVIVFVSSHVVKKKNNPVDWVQCRCNQIKMSLVSWYKCSWNYDVIKWKCTHV